MSLNQRIADSIFRGTCGLIRDWVFRCACLLIVVATQSAVAQSQSSSAPVIKIWEFSPYDVEIWYGFERDVPLSPAAREQFTTRLQQELERTFRAAWRLRLVEVSPGTRGQIARRFDTLTMSDLTFNDLVLVVSADHADTKTVRTLEAAIENLPEIAISAEDDQAFRVSLAAAALAENSPFLKLAEKLKSTDASPSKLREQLAAAEISAALIPKHVLDAQPAESTTPATTSTTKTSSKELLRPLLTWLPWQPTTVLRERDKVIVLVIGREGDEYTFRAKEIDCPMQFVGPTFSGASGEWQHAHHTAASLIVRAFAPVARVEDAESRSAMIRQRAGGLIVDENNPARLRVGDVMQPIIRRDDRNGMPALLEPLNFTYAAMIATDGIKGTVNVYTYSGGPGLQGRQNRRTQRVLLRVRPIAQQSDVQIAVRGEPGSVQSGCFIYNRDMLSEDFELQGRTDWRGRLTIAAPEQPVGIIPEAVRAAREQARREAAQKKQEAEAAAKAAIAAGGEGAAAQPTETQPIPPVAGVAESEQMDAGPDKEVIYLNQPLLHLYIKSGDMVLAKLPYVPGQTDVDIAQLGDDSLRLKSEAFVRGFQGEILDLIGLRNLLYARVKLYMKDNKTEEAQKVLEEFRKLRTFNEMSDQLSLIQRRMLEESGEEVPRAARSRIDKMFQTTRDMLQKYLQDELLVDAERLVNNPGQG